MGEGQCPVCVYVQLACKTLVGETPRLLRDVPHELPLLKILRTHRAGHSALPEIFMSCGHSKSGCINATSTTPNSRSPTAVFKMS
jgi:hypothetical protein